MGWCDQGNGVRSNVGCWISDGRDLRVVVGLQRRGERERRGEEKRCSSCRCATDSGLDVGRKRRRGRGGASQGKAGTMDAAESSEVQRQLKCSANCKA